MRKRISGLFAGLAFIIAILAMYKLPIEMKEIQWFIVLFAFLYHGQLLGQALFPKFSWKMAMPLGIVLFLALQSIAQTAWYYLGTELGAASDMWSLLFAVIVSQIISVIPGLIGDPCPNESQEQARRSVLQFLSSSVLLFVALISTIFVIRGAANAATIESIRATWPLLPDGTLLAIALVWLTLLLSAIFLRSSIFTTAHSALAIFSTTSIAPLVYKLGFGFDGFLHVASEKILLATGTLTPKPFYYIGQYVFTTWFARLTELSVADIDRWLVPVGAAILLPLSILMISEPVISSVAERSRSEEISPLALLGRNDRCLKFLILGLLPLSAFIATTPQNFAYVLGLSALILSLGIHNKTVNPITPLILLGWAIATHPLAGLPLLFVVLAVILWPHKGAALPRGKRLLSALCVALAGAAIPIAFYVLGLRQGIAIEWNLNAVFSFEPWLHKLKEFLPWIGNRFVLWPTWSSLIAKALPLLLLISSVGGVIVGRRTQDAGRRSIYIASALVLWISATILKSTGEFTFLIDYERGNYADRLNTLALFCLIPAAIPGITAFWKRARTSPKIILIGASIFFVGISTALAYNSLPRHDAMITGRGWSTSKYDFEAVRLIDRDTANSEYTVLANQSVSAAAVATLGFKRYADDIFFYPIPTGGKLYETYLKMTYNEPSLDTVKDAAELGRTELVYVVINDYWWRAQAVSEAVREISHDDWEIGDGKIRIYKFDFSADSSSSTTVSNL
ncbi:MAG: hypothetical protein ABII13_02025 [Patescibacteria group bacterium]|nr:hypothetical protein [Patescibacteria group bacterium]MBU2509104.1 hypothetical protein [Patescibacteria group bacterium]